MHGTPALVAASTSHVASPIIMVSVRDAATLCIAISTILGSGLAVSTSSPEVISASSGSMSSTSLVFGCRGGQHNLHSAIAEFCDELPGIFEHPQAWRQLLVIRGVQVLGAFSHVVGLVARDQCVQQFRRVHSDAPVETRSVYRNLEIGKSVSPGLDVQIVRIDQGSIDIKKNGTHGS
jgi:hypothetical protein